MLEIACFNAASAIAASKHGAARIELCAGYAIGGTTPSLEDVHQLLIKVFAAMPCLMGLRPHGTGEWEKNFRRCLLHDGAHLFAEAGSKQCLLLCSPQ